MALDANNVPVKTGDRVLVPCVELGNEPVPEGTYFLRVAVPDNDGRQPEFALEEKQLRKEGHLFLVPCLVANAQPSNSDRNLLLKVEVADHGDYKLTFAVNGRQAIKVKT